MSSHFFQIESDIPTRDSHFCNNHLQAPTSATPFQPTSQMFVKEYVNDHTPTVLKSSPPILSIDTINNTPYIEKLEVEVTPLYLDVDRCKSLKEPPQTGDIIAYKVNIFNYLKIVIYIYINVRFKKHLN